MANEKVSQMTPLSAAELAADDVFLITDTSQKQSKKISTQDLLTYFEATGSFNAASALTAVSASYILGSGVNGTVVSASHANRADTASYALNTVFGSTTTGSLVPVTSSWSQTSSFLQYSTGRSNGTASFAVSASSVLLAVSSSFLVSIPGVNNGTASFALSSSQASTSSYSNTANFTISSSFSVNAVTASISNTASFVMPYSIIPAGTVITFASSTVPSGWLECNGAEISRSVYSALYTSIGTTYGSGNGSSTFNLPDLRGYFIRGWDNSRGVDTGRTFGSAQTDALKDHTHNGSSQYITSVQRGSADTSVFTPTNHGDGSSALTNTNLVTLPNGGKTETRPVNIAMLYLIKY